MISSRSKPSTSLLGVAQGVGKTRLGQPEHPHHAPGGTWFGPRSPAAPPRFRTATGHIGCSSRGGPGNTTTVGLPGTTTPGAVPTGSITCAPTGISACLRLAARDRLEVHVVEARHQSLDDVGDPVLERVVQHQFEAAESGHGRHGHVVGGRAEAAAGDDEVHALVGEEPQLRLDVVGSVAADRDVGQFDAELEQPVGDPRAVAVLDPPRQHLGSRDNDAGACAHVQTTSTAGR